MKIGIMLRSADEKGGVGVYTQNIVEELLTIDQQNEYVLYFRTRENVERYSGFENATIQVLPGKSKAYWDQVTIPYACYKDGIDVLFHPKFTIPFLAPCKTIMVVHGADWFMPDQAQFYGWLDVQYVRAVMPFYFRKCDRVISVSELTTKNFYQILNLPDGKINTIYFGPARHFQRITDEALLEKTRQKYSLPARFMLTLTKRSGGKRKNLGKIFESYALYHAQNESPLPLVIGGKDCHLFLQEYTVDVNGCGADIHFPGWIEQQDLPAIYSMAELYLYPSNLEAFPIPLTEAMTCGTPIITSNVNGLKEIAGDAALFVDPQDAQQIADALLSLTQSGESRQTLSQKGLSRARIFSWRQCAIETLGVIEDVYQQSTIQEQAISIKE